MKVSRRKFLRHGAFAAAASCVSSSLLGWSEPLLAGRAAKTIKNQPPKPPIVKEKDKDTDWHNHADGIQHLTRETFAGATGTTFKVYDRSGVSATSWLTLLSVRDLPLIQAVNPATFAKANKVSTNAPTSTGFVLSFRGSAPAPLPQGTFLLEHSNLGKFALFLVPSSNNQQLYVAVINRLNGSLHTQHPLISAPIDGPGSGGRLPAKLR